MKRFLKWAAVCAGVLAALLLSGLLCIFGIYYRVVRAQPGALEVNAAPGPLGALVNPFIGTGGYPWMCGHDTPAATTPFGMVRLGPDTASLFFNARALNKSGYHFADNKIIGFSHTRLVGGDTLEGGVFRIFPSPASRLEQARGRDRFARFSHWDEKAFPGYYAVWLPKERTLVELTATPRVGVHRYTFRMAEAPHLLMDVTSVPGDRRCEDGLVMILSEARELEGSVRTLGTFSGRYGGLKVYFVARFSQPFAEFGTWHGGHFQPGADSAAGNDIGVDLGFAGGGPEQVIEVCVALSHVSVRNARLNLKAEAAGRSFEEVTAAAREAWEKRLACIRVRGGTERQQRIFYSALYRCFQMPTVFNDVNGEYLGFDRAVHKAEGFRYFTDFSLWDTFRTVHPLFNLVAREDERDMMVSLVEMAKAGGCLPRWPAGCDYTNCMFGTPADIAVTEAYLKGIRDFDIETAYRSMRETALTGTPGTTRFSGRGGLEAYLTLGYCPSDTGSKSVSRTLEYAYADYALSLLARELGHADDAATFAGHARYYRNLWNPATQHFEERDRQGSFPEERNPLVLSYADFTGKYARGYAEGSGEQWRWAVPFDTEGLLSLFESRAFFVSELERYFAKSKRGLGPWNPGPYYWHGNEPYIHAAYLFNTAGRPDLTQKWVRWILDRKYGDDPVGLDGNDDGGTLSAWYVLSALGFYPIAGTTTYELGAPLFAEASVQIGDCELRVVADNYAPENIYVHRVWLNDTVLARTSFKHDEIAKGGTLRFEMAPEPAHGTP